MNDLLLENILCAVDFSDNSANALRYAAALRACRRARLTVLHADVLELPPYFTESQLGLMEDEWRRSEEAAKQHLRRFAAETLTESPAELETIVVRRAPVEAILQAAEQTHAELIVLGTRGRGRRGGLGDVLAGMLGGTAEQLLHRSEVPVVTVPERFLVPAGELRARTILCPVNHTRAARESFQYAAKLARCLGATLTAVHVEEPDAAERIDDLPAWTSQLADPPAEVRTLRSKGKAADEVLRFAAEEDVDLLVIGACRRTLFDCTVIGSTTAMVVRHAPCPVLSVPTRSDASNVR